MEELDNIQKLCVDHKDGPMLILSGAGTGKTRVIVNRFRNLVSMGINQHRILCLTFSNKAANEFGERLKDLNPRWIGTFHSICFKLLQIYNILDDKTIILDEIDSKKVADQLGILPYLNTIQRMKDWANIEYSEMANKAANAYDDYLGKNNMVDFGDLILKTIYLMETNEEIKNQIKNRFDYIMVDEFQDTSKVQNHLIKLFLKNENICCVGDVNQCIYTWRGAYIKNILDFPKEFKECKMLKMQRNYRSTTSILKVANAIIADNTEVKNELWTDKTGDKVVICNTQNDGEFIAKTIKSLPKDESVVILVRGSNSIMAIEEGLNKFNINYKLSSGTKFLDTKEIKTLLSYFNVIYRKSIFHLENIINYPRRGIGEKRYKIINDAIEDGLDMFDSISLVDDALANQLREMSQLFYVKDSIDYLLNKIGLKKEFADRMENIEILLNKVGELSINDFLNNILQIGNQFNNISVMIMTIHSSKGLEFDNVFVPFMIEGNFPNSRAIETNIDEEYRLAYVATTRAKKRLFFSYNINGSKKQSTPSRFLFNLPKDSVIYINN